MKNDSREFPVGFSGGSFSFVVGFEMTCNIFRVSILLLK